MLAIASFASRTIIAGVLISVLAAGIARAENYMAGQIGVNIPGNLSDVKVPGPGGDTFSDLSLRTSPMFGAKIGHYFEAIRWLGIETEVFSSYPNLKQQAWTRTTAGVPTTGIEPGADLFVLTWAANVVVRYQMGKLEPYAGIGPAIFFAHMETTAPASSFGETWSTTLGLNALAGLRYRVSDHLALFGEWKYNHTKFNFTGAPSADYSASLVALGVGYHF